jgi:glycosyltransferase involved in cell wall biosynthesis
MSFKILLVNWQDRTNPLGGGAEIHLHEIFGRLAKGGDEVWLLCSSYPGAAPTEFVDGIRVMRRGGRFTFNLTAVRAYLQELAREQFDIVVEDINKIPFYTPLYVRCPVLALVPHLFGTTVFQEAVAPLATYVYLWELAIPFVYRQVQFEVISESTGEDLVARGIPRHHIEVVHCGIDRGLYRPGGRRDPAPLVLYLGRLKKYKRVDFLLNAMMMVKERVPGARLILVGGGDHLETLRRDAERLGLSETVSFRGYVSDQEKVDYLQRAHVVANPSPKEGWGLTGVEANACGTPVVASDSPGLRDSIAAGESGLLVPHGDVSALADAIVSLLVDEDLNRKLSAGAVEWAKRFSWDEAALRTRELIEAVVSRRRGAAVGRP